MASSSVLKPGNAGTGQLAIILTSGGFVNVRSGPGTSYADIGDIANSTQVTYYPNSRTSDGWLWVEQYGLAGWVSSSVVTFEHLNIVPPSQYPPTPYDGKIAVWHWKGESVPENTIEEFALNLRKNAPNVSQVWVKIGDGNAWQGTFDSGDMAINGPADVDRWVQILARHGLEFHAWIVLKGVDINGEANIMIQACQRPNVKSLILDVEPYDGYWEAGPGLVRPLMTQVRRALGGRYHIGLSIDPRTRHYESIYPREWLPFVNSVHPQSYWQSFVRSVEDTLQEVQRVWGTYGRPVIPALQGAAPLEEQREAQSIVTQRFGWKGISWWRYGVIPHWSAINTPVTVGNGGGSTGTPTETPPVGTVFGKEVLIFAGKEGHRSGTYTGRQELIKFTGAMGWDAYYVRTEVQRSKVWSEWKTDLPDSGYYQISVFIPARYTTTTKARYKIHAVRGTNTEVVVDLNQSLYRNQWVPLGVFDLVKGAPNAGKVFLNDVTGEPDKEIAFDAVRLRQIVPVSNQTPTNPGEGTTIPDMIDGVYVADGYDSPVGTEQERRGTKLWSSEWRDAAPFAKLYFVGTVREAYHTGADLNYGSPYADLGMPVYSPASGIVTYQADLRPWGNVTVIRHDPLKSPTGKVFYSRYGHMQNLRVNVGDHVRRGQQIGEIGDGSGRFVPHLHFDISNTNRLEERPGDWPGKDLQRLLNHYVDPLIFIRNNRP